ncbi:MlaD family protein [Hirschia baltica]|uniref:Mammalian cell entry related domain protein n=1 Tax=Hirschia baltica (strain ATCC 49814 / DSM 5838 / IFAM 1418) TaxID=582402 RepID=C6XKM3_HIRBI|nr:MlaD family protein [Hirschia baltica]ACT59590.1 Mammalian cell entry related domain protein [Hirschia baltica ATCC 49814]
MRDSLFETIVGIAVVAAAGVFLWFSLQQSEKTAGNGSYELTAQFTGPINGVLQGTDVRLMGVKVGVVTDVELDKARLVPKITMNVAEGIELDEDTTAKIASDGFLSGPHIALLPGSGLAMLEPGDEILYTSGSVELGPLLTEFATSLDGRLKNIAEAISANNSAAQ